MHNILMLSAEMSEQLSTFLTEANSHELLMQAMASMPTEIPNALSYHIDGDKATFRIEGLIASKITATDLIFSKMFGANLPVTYDQIANTITELNENPQVKSIELLINSVGGHVDGIDTAITALRNSQKPITSKIEHYCVSAGYWLASQTQRIEASSRLSLVGSVGVMVMFVDTSKVDERMGIQTKIIRSSHAPNKNLDPNEEAGTKAIQSRVDKVEAMFLADIAHGRGETLENIIANYGAGSMMFAHDALDAGMIDSVQDLPQKSQEKNNPEGEDKMSITKEESEKLVAQAREEERNRITKLQKIVQQFPCEASEKLVDDAIRSGKSYEDVAPDAMEIGKNLIAQLKEQGGATVEQPPHIQPPAVDNITTPQADATSVDEKQFQEECKSILAKLEGGNY